jgi:hypothetical protein
LSVGFSTIPQRSRVSSPQFFAVLLRRALWRYGRQEAAEISETRRNAVSESLKPWHRLAAGGVPEDTVTRMTVRGLVMRDPLGRLALTGRGRAIAKAMLPDCNRR